MPALPVDSSLVFVVALVVTNNVVAIRVLLVEHLVRFLLSAFFPFAHDVIWVKYGLMLAFLVESKLLFAALVCVRGAYLDNGLSELLAFQVNWEASLLDLINRCVGTLTEKDVCHFSLQVV